MDGLLIVCSSAPPPPGRVSIWPSPLRTKDSPYQSCKSITHSFRHTLSLHPTVVSDEEDPQSQQQLGSSNTITSCNGQEIDASIKNANLPRFIDYHTESFYSRLYWFSRSNPGLYIRFLPSDSNEPWRISRSDYGPLSLEHVDETNRSRQINNKSPDCETVRRLFT